MALQASGQISLDDLHVEAGGTTGTECSLNDADIRNIISKGDGQKVLVNTMDKARLFLVFGQVML